VLRLFSSSSRHAFLRLFSRSSLFTTIQMKDHLVVEDGVAVAVSSVATHPLSERRELMRQSTFCVIPGGGYRWTTLPVAALLLNCIPVIVSEHRLLLPLEEGLDWSGFAIHWPAARLSELRHHLENLSSAEVTARQMLMLQVWQYFSFDHRHGRAPEMIMSLLARRMQSYQMKRAIWSSGTPGDRVNPTDNEAAAPDKESCSSLGCGIIPTSTQQELQKRRLHRRWLKRRVMREDRSGAGKQS
jgi:Exostosin family